MSENEMHRQVPKSERTKAEHHEEGQKVNTQTPVDSIDPSLDVDTLHAAEQHALGAVRNKIADMGNNGIVIDTDTSTEAKTASRERVARLEERIAAFKELAMRYNAFMQEKFYPTQEIAAVEQEELLELEWKDEKTPKILRGLLGTTAYLEFRTQEAARILEHWNAVLMEKNELDAEVSSYGDIYKDPHFELSIAQIQVGDDRDKKRKRRQASV